MERNEKGGRGFPFPRIGFRIIKTAVAVFLILAGFRIAGFTRTPFYAAIATILCMQPDLHDSRTAAVNRTIGTFIGACGGIFMTVLEVNAHLVSRDTWLHLVLVVCGIIILIYVTVLLHKTSAAFISCVVFLSISIVSRGGMDPYTFAFFRFLDTMTGILLAYFINWLHLPHQKRKDILFISSLDDTLVSVGNQLSPYSKRELNHMLDGGARFTIATGRTPAAMAELAGSLHLNLPVIAMHGAVLYDIKENRYLLEYIINHNTAKKIEEIMDENGFHYFENVIIDDVLLIYYQDFLKQEQKDYYEMLRKSPLRNYIHGRRPKDQDVVYFTVMDEARRLNRLRKILEEQEYGHSLRFAWKETEFEGQSVLYVLCKNATRENMIHYLQKMLGAEEIVTFGSIEGKYDVVVRDQNMDLVVRTMKKLFEPIGF